jgi:hypothetical protein
MLDVLREQHRRYAQWHAAPPSEELLDPSHPCASVERVFRGIYAPLGNFLLRLMHPEPKNRPTADEALAIMAKDSGLRDCQTRRTALAKFWKTHDAHGADDVLRKEQLLKYGIEQLHVLKQKGEAAVR